MTIIVGIAERWRVTIGGDSAAGGENWRLTPRRDRKVFRVGEFVIGFTTSFRMGQLLAFAFTPPPVPEGRDLMAYMVLDFVPAIQACFERGKWGGGQTSDAAAQGGQFLVGFRGRLFCIESDYQVAEPEFGYWALGCGEEYALGALYATLGDTPEGRVKAALNAAVSFSGGCCPPFHIVATDGREPPAAAGLGAELAR